MRRGRIKIYFGDNISAKPNLNTLIPYHSLYTKKIYMDAIEKSSTELLGDDMKQYEAEYETTISGDHAFIIRADGHSFSNFTKGFFEPFDDNFKKAMILTMNDCIDKFHAVTGYTHSDEITLIFPQAKLLPGSSTERQTHFFSGRVCKILTLVASYISVRFNYHLVTLVTAVQASIGRERYTDAFMQKLLDMSAHFDARILAFGPDDLIDIARHMIWRSLKDCTQNCISTYARVYYSDKHLHGKNGNEMIEMMREKGLNWETDVPEDLKIGTYAKKELYGMEAVDKATGHTVVVQRGRIVNKVMKAQNNVDFLDMLLRKYW